MQIRIIQIKAIKENMQILVVTFIVSNSILRGLLEYILLLMIFPHEPSLKYILFLLLLFIFILIFILIGFLIFEVELIL